MSSSLDYSLISQAAAAAFAAARLLHFNLRRRFPMMLVWLLLISLSSLVFSPVDTSSHFYYWAYVIWVPTSWCILALAVRETFMVVFRDFPGLQTAGRWAVYGALGFSSLIVLLFSFLFAKPVLRGGGMLPNYLVMERSVDMSLALVILGLLYVLSRYPLHLDRNTLVSSTLFSIISLAEGLVKLWDSLSPHLSVRKIDSIEIGFEAICLLAWGILLRASNATSPARPPANPVREAELLQQLETLNNILTRSTRR